MPGAKSRASAVWRGDLTGGSGRLAVASGAVGELPISWGARVERTAGATSPEELMAAAHASCFAMAFSNILAGNGAPPDELNVEATCTFEQVGDGFKITTMDLAARGRVPGISSEEFQRLAEQAKDGCPVSGALKGNVEIRLQAQLVP